MYMGIDVKITTYSNKPFMAPLSLGFVVKSAPSFGRHVLIARPIESVSSIYSITIGDWTWTFKTNKNGFDTRKLLGDTWMLYSWSRIYKGTAVFTPLMCSVRKSGLNPLTSWIRAFRTFWFWGSLNVTLIGESRAGITHTSISMVQLQLWTTLLTRVSPTKVVSFNYAYVALGGTLIATTSGDSVSHKALTQVLSSSHRSHSLTAQVEDCRHAVSHAKTEIPGNVAIGEIFKC